MELLLLYLTIINAAAFLLMLIDKQKARKKRWRIPERVLLGCCAIGGSLGGLIGMRLFRHKTLHWRFAIGIPVMLVIHILLGVLAYLWQIGVI